MQIGVGIFSFDRPHYLSKCIESLEKNDNTNILYHLFQDGGTSVASQNIDLFRHSSLSGTTTLRDRSFGCHSNFYYTFKELLNKYKYVVILEDDIVVSPHFMSLMKALLKQYEETNVAAIRIDRVLRCKEDEIENYRDILSYTEDISDWGSFGVWSTKWKNIMLEYEKYQKLVESSINHPHEEIRELFAQGGFPQILSRGFDGALTYAVLKSGFKQLSTIVPRVSHIGIVGLHHYGNDVANELYYFNTDKSPGFFGEIS